MSQVIPPGKGNVRAPQPAAVRQPVRSPAAVIPQVSLSDPSQRTPLAILGGLILLLVLAYLDMFALTRAEWGDPLYSHGWIVPVFALGIMWLRWEPFGPVPAIERWVGVGLLAAGLLFRLVGTYFSSNPIDRYSFLPALFGVFMIVGGYRIIRWAGPALAFLIFMFPLPSRIERFIHPLLQDFASRCSTFALQTMGIAAYRQGNVIHVAGLDVPLTVAEACSGLRMLTIFIALAVAMVFLVERPWWDKLIILLSAIPIALLVNIIRIDLTGLAYLFVGQDSEVVKLLAHDWAGYIMMPMALGFLWIELQILEHLTIPVETAQLRPVGGARGVTVPVR